MGATLKYVKDFDFGPQKASSCNCGGPVKKAKGGTVVSPAKAPKIPESIQARAMNHAKMMQETRAAQRAMPATRIGQEAVKPGGVIPLKKGGTVKNPETGEEFPNRRELEAHEEMETPAMKSYEKRTGKEAMPSRKGVPVASMSPLIVIAMGHKPPKK